MNKLTSAVSVLATASILGLLGWATYRGEQQSKQLAALGAQVEQQSMLMNRALGKVVPLVLPPDVTTTMAEIEGQLAEEAQWPNELRGVQKINEKLTRIVDSLPPWAQEEFLPRMVPRRWEIDALWVLANEPEAGETNLLNHAKAIESLLSQKPNSASDILQNRLEVRQTALEAQLAKEERAAAISIARDALDGKADPELAVEQVSIYEDDESQSLCLQLRKEIGARAFSNGIDAIHKELSQCEGLDISVQEYAYSRAYQAALDLRLRLASANLPDRDLPSQLNALEIRVQDKITELTKSKQARDAEKIKEYQKWALSQIKQVRNYDDVLDVEKSKIAGKWDRTNPLSEESKKAGWRASEVIRGELIRFMAPINQGVLDEAVNQLFRKVYQSRFDKLNEGDQLTVIEGFAVADKRPWIEP